MEIVHKKELVTPTEIHAVKPVKKQQALIARLQLQAGQIIWECDVAKGQMQAASFEEAALMMEDNLKHKGTLIPFAGQSKRKLIMKPGCIYCAAINQKNAKKKFIKMVKEEGLDITEL